MPIVIEDADMPAIRRFLATLFGVPIRNDAAAHAATQALIQQLQQQVQTMSDTFATKLAQLQSDVAAQKTVNDSAVTLIQGFSGQLADLKAQLAAAGVSADQLAAIDALDASVKQNTAALAAAIPQNTPAAGGGTPPATGADTTGGAAAGTTATPSAPSSPSPAPGSPTGTATAPTPGAPT